MDLDHAGHRGDGAAHSVQIDARGGGFEQHVHRLAHEFQRPRRDDQGDHPAHDRVEALPAGQRDHHARDDDPDGGERVRDDVHAGAPQVDVLRRPREEEDARQVRQEPDQGDAQHQRAFDRQGIEEAPHRLVEDSRGDRDQERAVEQGREDLEPVIAVRLGGCRRQGGETHGHETEDQGQEIGQDMTRVRQQCQAS